MVVMASACDFSDHVLMGLLGVYELMKCNAAVKKLPSIKVGVKAVSKSWDIVNLLNQNIF